MIFVNELGGWVWIQPGDAMDHGCRGMSWDGDGLGVKCACVREGERSGQVKKGLDEERGEEGGAPLCTGRKRAGHLCAQGGRGRGTSVHSRTNPSSNRNTRRGWTLVTYRQCREYTAQQGI